MPHYLRISDARGVTSGDGLALDPSSPLDARNGSGAPQVCSLAPLVITRVIERIAETAGLRGLKGHRTPSPRAGK